MDVSIAICTRNRSASLARALESLCAVMVPDDVSWEVLVVDNGSSDDTPSVADRYAGRLPLRYVREPEPGIAMARNRAVDGFDGEYLVWIDDDVTIAPGWLAAYLDGFRRWPDAAVFGGPIVPVLEGDPPLWLRENLDVVSGAYAARTEVDEAPIDPDAKLPLGANFAIRGREQRRHRFDAKLGRTPDRPHRIGEETGVLLDVFEAGAKGRWLPRASVDHHVPPARQTRRYLWHYFFGAGQESAMTSRTRSGGVQFLGRPRWAWHSAVEAPVRSLLARLRGDHGEELRRLREGARAWGVIRGVPSVSVDCVDANGTGERGTAG